MENHLVIIISTLVACAFFSGLEMAFLTSNKLKIELDRKQGLWSAKIFSDFVKKPSRFISTILLGNCISIVIYGMYAEEFLEPYIEHVVTNNIAVFALKILISTIFILLTAEFIPKTLFSINPNRTLQIFAAPFIVIYYLLFPLVYFTIGISELILKMFSGGSGHHLDFTFGKADLENYVHTVGNSGNSSENKHMDNEINIFKNALSFAEIKARECMIPRPEIIALDVEDGIEEIKAAFIETGLSKILIYRDTIDNIIGYVHSSELFKFPESIKNMLLPVFIIPETMPVNEVLTNFIQQRKSVAIVVDEFGGTSGMLTMEDVLEEIIGEIDDEHDDETQAERKISEDEYIFAGRLEVYYINKKYELNIPESDEYTTLAGYILSKTQSIPEKNQVLSIQKFTITILSVNKRKIELVKLKIDN